MWIVTCTVPDAPASKPALLACCAGRDDAIQAALDLRLKFLPHVAITCSYAERVFFGYLNAAGEEEFLEDYNVWGNDFTIFGELGEPRER